MSQMNGKGPKGKGPKTGRGLGNCKKTVSDETAQLGIGQGKRRKSGGGKGKGKRLKYDL